MLYTLYIVSKCVLYIQLIAIFNPGVTASRPAGWDVGLRRVQALLRAVDECLALRAEHRAPQLPPGPALALGNSVNKTRFAIMYCQ